MHKVPRLVTNTENKLACLLNINLHQESCEVVHVYGSNMLAVKTREPEFRLLALIKAVRQRWVLAVPDGEVEKGDGERLEKGSKVDLWSLHVHLQWQADVHTEKCVYTCIQHSYTNKMQRIKLKSSNMNTTKSVGGR